MKKEVVLTQYLETRKRSHIASVRDILISVLVLVATVILYLRFPSALNTRDWFLVFVFVTLYVLLFVYFFAVKNLIKTYKTIQKIKAEEYQIFEDTVIEKSVEKGPFFSKLYILGFENYAPEGRSGPHKNGVLATKKGYQKVNVGDKKYFLVLNGNKGWYTCSVDPSGQKQLV